MKRKLERQSRERNETFEVVTGLEELNWVEFPLALLSKNPERHLKTLRFQDTITDAASGERIQRRVLVSAADALSLPTWQDQDVLLALMKYTNDLHQFDSPIVPFTIYRILKLLNWPDNGAYRQRVKTALQRWNATLIRFENAFRRADRWTTEKGFHIISYYELNDVAAHDPDRVQHFEWHRVVFESIRAKHIRGFDWAFYLNLSLPSSKRLFRFLGKRFWQTPKYSPLLVPFCQEKMGMSRSYKPNRYRSLLTPAIDELSQKQFLASVPTERLFERIQHGVYRVHFHAYKRPAALVEIPPLVQELVSRGIDATEAHSLVNRFEFSRIGEQIRHFDAERRKKKNLRAGWLREAIVRNFTLPPNMPVQRSTRSKLAENSGVSATHLSEREKDRDMAESLRVTQLRTYLSSLSAVDRESLFNEALQLGPALIRRRYEASVRDGSQFIEVYREQLLFWLIEHRDLLRNRVPACA